jgi:hypothetical protein
MAKQTLPKGERPLTYDIFVRNPKLDRRGSMARISNVNRLVHIIGRVRSCLKPRQHSQKGDKIA